MRAFSKRGFTRYLLLFLLSLTIAITGACGGLKGPMIPKSNIPADINVGADVKKQIEMLYSSNDPKKRMDAAKNLGLMGRRAAVAVPFLIDMLKDKALEVQWWALIGLGMIGDQRAVEPLIAALKDRDEGVRKNAASALGYIKDQRAVEPLLAVLKDKDAEVREVAAVALREIKDPRSVEPLIIILMKDEDKDVRRNTALALGYIKDQRAVEPLFAALKDNDKGVRGLAALSLAEIKDSRAIEPLIAALNDENEYVRMNAAFSLGKVTGKYFGYDHAKWQAWWAENKNRQLASSEQPRYEADKK